MRTGTFNTSISINLAPVPSIQIRPQPIIRVPGSIPRIILEFFCRGNAIFECGVEQKYQINCQLCGRTAYYVVSFLYSCTPIAETTKLEGFSKSDVAGSYWETTLEVVLHVWTDGVELGSGIF